MGFLDREAKVAGGLGRVLSRSVIALGRGAVGGKIRRRVTLVVLAIGGAAGYIVLEWDVRGLLSDLLSLVFGVPAPGQPLAPATWLAPTNGVWPDVMTLSRASMGVAGVALLALFGRATMTGERSAIKRGLHRVGYAGLMVAATWTVLPFGLHLADALVTVLAPSPDQLLTSVASTAGDVGVLVLTAGVQPLLVALAVLAMAMLRAIIFAGFVLWPVAWPLRVIEHDLTERLGRSITALFTVAVATKLLQSLGAFGLIYLTGAIDSLLIRILIFIGGTVGVFVVLPLKMLQHAEQVMMLPGALAPSERQVGQAIEASADRVGQVHKHVESGRERVNEWRTPTDSREIFDTEFDDWRAAPSDDDGTGLLGGLGDSFDTDWVEWSSGDERWWSSWIQHELVGPTSAEWQRSETRASMDGPHGPDSEDPDAHDTESQGAHTDRDLSQWHEK